MAASDKCVRPFQKSLASKDGRQTRLVRDGRFVIPFRRNAKECCRRQPKRCKGGAERQGLERAVSRACSRRLGRNECAQQKLHDGDAEHSPGHAGGSKPGGEPANHRSHYQQTAEFSGSANVFHVPDRSLNSSPACARLPQCRDWSRTKQSEVQRTLSLGRNPPLACKVTPFCRRYFGTCLPAKSSLCAGM